MFTKAATFKTSAPLRSSDRRKLKNRIVELYKIIDPANADSLVPDGLLSVKFTTHANEPGVAYLAPDGNPLWFTIGKGADDLIPTVYTLWKDSTLLPSVSTPPQVINVLIGGADLMIPGVVTHSWPLEKDQLVSVIQAEEPGKVGFPLAVGQMVIDGKDLKEPGKKGKAVRILHTWKDQLWTEGSKADPPEAILTEENVVDSSLAQEAEDQSNPSPPLSDDEPDAQEDSYSPEEVSKILRTSLIQAISQTLPKLPPAAFPIPATSFYTAHILPSRPITLSGAIPVDIKHSSHKSLTAFLKAAEKEGLLKVKDIKTAGKSELAVIGVFATHVDVVTHRPYATLKESEAKREAKELVKEKEKNKVKEIVVTEMYKPHQMSVKFFAATENDTSELYMIPSIKAIITKYITEHDRINPHDPSHVNMDPVLSTILKANEQTEFMKRDALLAKVIERMQPWYEMQIPGKDTVVKKGQLKPISVIVKMRQGRKATTLITNFEPFLLTAEFLSEELRRICASATSVSPIVGKTSGLEVLVQGKNIPAVTDLLLSKGIPKKWIETADMTGKKK